MSVNRAGSLLGSPYISSRNDQSARNVISPLPAGIVSSGSGRRETGGGSSFAYANSDYGMNTYCTVAIMVGTVQTMDE